MLNSTWDVASLAVLVPYYRYRSVLQQRGYLDLSATARVGSGKPAAGFPLTELGDMACSGLVMRYPAIALRVVEYRQIPESVYFRQRM